MLGERGVDLPAAGQELRQVAHPVERHHLAFAGLVAAVVVHWLAGVLLPVSADGVEVLQREPQRVDDRVAGDARSPAGCRRPFAKSDTARVSTSRASRTVNVSVRR